MKKFLLIFLCLTVSLVSVFAVSSFADFESGSGFDQREVERLEYESDPPSRSNVQIFAGEIYRIVDHWDDYFQSSQVFTINYELGSLSGSGFVSSYDCYQIGFYRNAQNLDVAIVCSYGSGQTVTISRDSLVFDYRYILISDDATVDANFLNMFSLVETTGTHFILSSVADFFSGVLGLGSTFIDFLSSNWIAIIPLVLWVMVALFGVFRRFFKGV